MKKSKHLPALSACILFVSALTYFVETKHNFISNYISNDRVSGLAIQCLTPVIHGTLAMEMTCTFSNSGLSDALLLADPPIIEGPRDDELYLRMSIGYQRYQNMIEYHPATIEALDRSTQLHPFVLIDIDQAHFVRVSPMREIDLEFKYAPPIEENLFKSGEWLIRAKVMAAYEEILAPGRLGAEISFECEERLEAATRGAKKFRDGALELPAKRRGKGGASVINGCDEIISEKFQHIFSEDILFSVD